MIRCIDKALLLGTAAAWLPATAHTAVKPHIILIVADQFRGDCLGAVNPHIRTPNLDRLAREVAGLTEMRVRPME